MRKIAALFFMVVFFSGCAAASFNQRGVRDSEFAQMASEQNAFLSKEQMQAYQMDEFSKMDTDNDGRVSKKEYSVYQNLFD
ncbi:MAG: hypothetical protein V1670_04550 [Candidatus Omnitrophota bacterium]